MGNYQKRQRDEGLEKLVTYLIFVIAILGILLIMGIVGHYDREFELVNQGMSQQEAGEALR